MTRPGVVLLHGVGLDHTIFAGLLPFLGELDVRAPDLPGHGTAPRIESGETSLGALAAAVADDLHGPAHVAGFSLGGLVALRLAADRPELVRSLTLIATVGLRSDDERAAVAGRLARARADLGASFAAAVERWLDVGDPRADGVRRVLAANDPASYLACYRVFVEGDREVWPLLFAIRVPVLAITGADDPGSTPAMSRAIAAAVPDGRAVIVGGARHLLPLEAPEALARAIIETTRRADGDRGSDAVPALHRR